MKATIEVTHDGEYQHVRCEEIGYHARSLASRPEFNFVCAAVRCILREVEGKKS